MSTGNLLKQILEATRDMWDRHDTRPSVRENFARMLNCRTAALGAEVFASPTEEKIFFHTYKSRTCPSCGCRATLLWQRELWCSLPEISYVGINFTMPGVLWPIFKQNRHLLHDLSAVGAEVIQQWVKAKYGVRVLIMVVPHTFGAHLNFNSHLHILVSATGLHESEGRLTPRLRFDKGALMHMWRYAVIAYLREAHEKKAMMAALHREDAFPDMFVAYLLARNIRYEEDLVDQLFNSSEKRLARVLLMLAHFGKEGVPETVVPRISQETLAEIVGTTRSRVSFFMNRFRKLGFIHYNGGLQVHSSLPNVVLHD